MIVLEGVSSGFAEFGKKKFLKKLAPPKPKQAVKMLKPPKPKEVAKSLKPKEMIRGQKQMLKPKTMLKTMIKAPLSPIPPSPVYMPYAPQAPSLTKPFVSPFTRPVSPKKKPTKVRVVAKPAPVTATSKPISPVIRTASEERKARQIEHMKAREAKRIERMKARKIKRAERRHAIEARRAARPVSPVRKPMAKPAPARPTPVITPARPKPVITPAIEQKEPKVMPEVIPPVKTEIIPSIKTMEEKYSVPSIAEEKEPKMEYPETTDYIEDIDTTEYPKAVTEYPETIEYPETEYPETMEYPEVTEYPEMTEYPETESEYTEMVEQSEITEPEVKTELEPETEPLTNEPDVNENLEGYGQVEQKLMIIPYAMLAYLGYRLYKSFS